MYRLLKPVTAKTDNHTPTAQAAETKFGSKDIHDFLLSIEELRGQKITAVDRKDGSCDFTIGNTVYSLTADKNNVSA